MSQDIDRTGMRSVDSDWLLRDERRLLPGLIDVSRYCFFYPAVTPSLTPFFASSRFPLPLISIKMMDVFKNLYVVPGTCISVERAVELDARSVAQLSFSADVYRQPVLTEKLTEPQILRQRQSATEMTLERTSTDSGKIV